MSHLAQAAPASREYLYRLSLSPGAQAVRVSVAVPELWPLLDTFFKPYRVSHSEAAGALRHIEMKLEDGLYWLHGPSGEWYAEEPGYAAAYLESELNDALLVDTGDAIGLHGSAVCWDEGCILLLGASGTGKSTLTAGLCEMHGLEMLADDALLLDRVSVSVHAYARSLRVHTSGLERAGIPVPAMGNSYRHDPFVWIEPGRYAPRSAGARRPSALVFLDSAGEQKLATIGPGDSLRRALTSRLNEASAPDDFDVLVQLSQTVPSYRLGVADLALALDQVRALVG